MTNRQTDTQNLYAPNLLAERRTDGIGDSNANSPQPNWLAEAKIVMKDSYTVLNLCQAFKRLKMLRTEGPVSYSVLFAVG